LYIRLPTILLFFYIFIFWYKKERIFFIKVDFAVCEILVFDGRDKSIFSFFHSLDKKNLFVIKKSRIIVIKDDHNKRIYKYSFNDSAREIRNNFLALKDTEKLLSPKSIQIIEGVHGVLSVEELIDAKEISLKDLKSNIFEDSLYAKVCVMLNSFHTNTLEKVNINIIDEINQYDFLVRKKDIFGFNKVKDSLFSMCDFDKYKPACKARIHGDVTHRNILKKNQEIYFIDFERAGFEFPEFDFINFVLDFNMHNKRDTSYKSYICYLLKVYLEKEYISIFDQLRTYKLFKSKNPEILSLIYLKYLLRQIAIVTNVSYYERGIDIDSIYSFINKKIGNV